MMDDDEPPSLVVADAADEQGLASTEADEERPPPGPDARVPITIVTGMPLVLASLRYGVCGSMLT